MQQSPIVLSSTIQYRQILNSLKHFMSIMNYCFDIKICGSECLQHTLYYACSTNLLVKLQRQLKCAISKACQCDHCQLGSIHCRQGTYTENMKVVQPIYHTCLGVCSPPTRRVMQLWFEINLHCGMKDNPFSIIINLKHKNSLYTPKVVSSRVAEDVCSLL